MNKSQMCIRKYLQFKILHKKCILGISKMWFAFNVNFNRDIKNFGQISILLNKTKIVEKHKKDRPHFGNSKTKDTLCLLETLEFYC